MKHIPIEKIVQKHYELSEKYPDTNDPCSFWGFLDAAGIEYTMEDWFVPMGKNNEE